MAKLTLKGSCQKKTSAAAPVCHFQFEEWSEKALPRVRFMGKLWKIRKSSPFSLRVAGKFWRAAYFSVGYFYCHQTSLFSKCNYIGWVSVTGSKLGNYFVPIVTFTLFLRHFVFVKASQFSASLRQLANCFALWFLSSYLIIRQQKQ